VPAHSPPLANGTDGLRRHAEIEPAFVVGKGDMHDTVAIARHRRKLSVAPIPRRVEQHHKEIDDGPGPAGDLMEQRHVLNAGAIGGRHPDIEPRVLGHCHWTPPGLKLGLRALLASRHGIRHEIDSEGRTRRDRRIEKMDREIARQPLLVVCLFALRLLLRG